ncbi:MAG: hypothetical protein KTR28_01040 [Micavibrio sp.]|nr:hypothetical protein [Micavibrio sp.]
MSEKKLIGVHIFTTDSKGLLLEMNPGERSNIACLNQKYGVRDTIADIIAPDIQKTLGDTYNVIALRNYGHCVKTAIGLALSENPQNKKTNIIIRGHDMRSNLNVFDISRSYENTILDNYNFAIEESKGNKSFMFNLAKKAGAQNFPISNTCTKPELHTLDMTSYASQSVVIKPVDGFQGHGVLIVPTKDFKAVAKSLSTNNFDEITSILGKEAGYGLKYWKKNHENIYAKIQVQEFLKRDSFVHHKGKEWDATDRHLWAVLAFEGSKKMLDVKVQCYGSFHQLPEKPVAGHELSQSSAISYATGRNNLFRAVAQKLHLKRRDGGGEKVYLPENQDRYRGQLAENLKLIFEYAIMNQHTILPKQRLPDPGYKTHELSPT